MAAIGLKYVAWAPVADEPQNDAITYGTGLVLGRAVSSNLTVSNAEGELYADDVLSEYVAEFANADFTMEVDNIELANQAMLYGANFDSVNGLRHYSDDTAPNGGIGGIQSVMVRGVRKYRVWFLAKAKAAIPDETGATKGSSISFSTQPIKMKVMAPSYGPWKIVKEFTTEGAARAFVDTLLNVAAWYSVDVQAQGTTPAAYATPVGTTAVAEGDAFTMEVAGTPIALYDNGADKLADIADEKYTIASVTEKHYIAVIF